VPCSAYYTATRNAEFMIDFRCMSSASHEMLLAAESEWINNAAKVVDDDFQKLVYVRSRFRMLIFQMDEKNVLDKAGAFLRQYKNHSVGDNYIFARIDWSERKIAGWKIAVGPNNQIGDPIQLGQ
jgi:hypothetical protein